MRKVTFLISTTVLAVATPVWAQETPKPADEAGADDPTAIIVTATKRSESLSNVPIAISAVSGETLQNTGATDIRSLNQVAPSLLVSGATAGVNNTARIRGVGTVGENAGLESSVGLFIDGVYRSRTGVGLSELIDIDRIEVLRGPQGTLAGKNSTAGLINVVTKRPSFDFEAKGSATYGNYDYYRVDGSVTGGLTKTIAGKLDGVYVKRDGFTKNVTLGQKDSNDRDRYAFRGQLLFQPQDDFSVRLIADYTKQSEICCAAPFLQPVRTVTGNPVVGNGNNPGGAVTVTSGNPILNALNALGANYQLDGPGGTFVRRVATTPGFNYDAKTKDYGFSGEVNYDLGGVKLTSITAYRDFKNRQGQDQDFTALDILRRTALDRQFKLFTQELRLQGKLFSDRIDWLVGGYFADERLDVSDDSKFGVDADRALNCIVIARGLIPGATVNTAAPNCANNGGTFPGFAALASTLGVSPLAGTGINSLNFNQRSRNYAIFTHNVIDILPEKLSLTLGGRYTNERKDLSGRFSTNNNLCSALRNAGSGLAAFPCAINNDAGPGFNKGDPGTRRSENQFTGTAVLSFKPIKGVLTYASFSKGYKAGGFNLDIASLDAACITNAGGATPTPGQTAANNACRARLLLPANTIGNGRPEASDLQFARETVNAYEIGVKIKQPGFSLNIAAFRQEFSNFQLNAFNGINFQVSNITSCKGALTGGPGSDRDNNNATGSCAGRLRDGVLSKGVEVEGVYSPLADLTLNFGLTYSDTKYRNNLTSINGGALGNALNQLPGRQISNAPKYTATGGIGFTPEVTSSGLRALLYLDARYQSDTNTGSDLDPEKVQNAFVLINGRIGLTGPDGRWGIELFGQNLFNKKYQQIAADAPFQGASSIGEVTKGNTSLSNQLFIAFPGEPRTYGITLRGKF